MLINITKINLNPNVGGGKPIELENKEITITENGTTTVVPSDGFGGLSSVDITTDVPTPKVEANKSISITENGAYTVTPSTGYVGVGDVDINVFVSEIGTSIDFSQIGYNATDNANVNMNIQDGIEYAKKIQTEYTDSKTYYNDNNLIYLPYIDTSNRTSCNGMFDHCHSLQYVPPLTITDKCTNLNYMFRQCGALKNIDVSNWDTSNVTSMSSMFDECFTLETLDLSNWDTSNVKYMGYMFSDCTNIKNFNISGWDFSKFTSLPNNFFDNSTSDNKLLVETINVTNCNVSTLNDFKLFTGKANLKNIIGLNTLNISNFNSLASMFSGCQSLTSLDLSNWDTSNVTNMSTLFNNCTSLTNIIGIENWNTSNVTVMDNLFSYCQSLTSLDLSNWDTSSLNKISSNSTSSGMFRKMSNLETLNVTNFNTSQCTYFDNLFEDCKSLTNIIGIENWDTSNVISLRNLFLGATSIENLNLSGWDLSSCTGAVTAFGKIFNELKITNFQAPQNINTSITFTYCPNLTVDSLMSILNNLTDRTSTTSLTCTLGTANLIKLTAEQKAVATSKNWVLN